MPTETGRHRLYEKIKEQWGEEHAAELMSYLPPVGWADVATKQDLSHLATELRLEMATGSAGLRAEMATGSAGLRGEMSELRAEMSGLRAEMSGLGVEMSELRAEMHQELGKHLRWMLGSTMTAMVILTGLFAVIVGVIA
jgi:sirohydrochlorin ferrochelatase